MISLSISTKPILIDYDYKNRKFAVVYHGKILDVDFLSESMKSMRRNYSESIIILSTYSADISETLREICRVENIEISAIQESQQLQAPYAANLARAVGSAYNGLLLAQNLGAEYALKLRVDQDIKRKDGIKFLEHLLEGRVLPQVNPNVIIGTSYNSYVNAPIFLSDMLHFGRVETLLRYWKTFDANDIDLITNEIFSEADESLNKWRFVPEVWLAARFLYSSGEKIRNHSEINEVFWGKYAGVIDSIALGQIWAKTHRFFDSNYKSIKWFEGLYSDEFLEFHFTDWVNHVLEYTYKSSKEVEK